MIPVNTHVCPPVSNGRMRMNAAAVIAALSTALAIGSTLGAPSGAAARVEAGRQMYEKGVLPSGKPLVGRREDGLVIQGEDAACILCHRRSGMGLAEGASLVPPVSAAALFGKLELATHGRRPRQAPGMTFSDWPFKTRPPYDDATLAHALRAGVSNSGHRFQYLMPRYELAERDMSALIAYLRTLSGSPSPGASASEAHFATVLAPGVAPARRAAFLGVLNSCVAEKFPPGSARQGWRLHVWELDGPASSWAAQLAAHYARRPVFALVSGLGADEWGPVEAFCEKNGIPCLFPNTDAPGSPHAGQYSFYFFRGTLREADVIAVYLAEQRERLGLQRAILVSRADSAGARAAAALAERASREGLRAEQRLLRRLLREDVAAALEGLGDTDALIMLLRDEELAALARFSPEPPRAGALMVSGLLGGLEQIPLPPSWRRRALMTYPFDPPVRWNRRMDFNLRPWLAAQRLGRGDERMQGNTLAACNLLYEGMLRLRGQYLRDYLVENIENYPTSMGNAPAAQAFPRFSLGPGQRFSSKGAHVVRFAGPDARQLVPEQEWLVP